MINIKYKLDFFGLTKQTLKRKLNVNSPKKLKKLIEKRGTSYFLFEIKYIIETLYKNMTINEKISSYHKENNIKKYNYVLDLIDLEEKDNLYEKIDNEILNIYNNSMDIYMSDDILEQHFIKIAEKYSVTLKYIHNKFIKLNEIYDKKLINEIC